MTIRKNFLFDEKIVEHLEKIAKSTNISQTRALRNMIEKEYIEVSKKEKLEAFYAIVGTSNGLYVGKSIQSIKANMDV